MVLHFPIIEKMNHKRGITIDRNTTKVIEIRKNVQMIAAISQMTVAIRKK